MPADLNRFSDLLGVEASDADALPVGIQDSPLNLGRLTRMSAPKNLSLFHHFNTTTTIPAGLSLVEEGTTTAAATYGTGLGGTAVITTDDVAAKSDQLFTQLNYQVNRQDANNPLVFEARWKTGATLTANEFFLGFTDAINDTDPIALSATSTFTTSVPTNAVVMGYSDTPTSGAAFTSGGNQHVMISINGDANTIEGVGGGAFAAATYYTYRIEITSAGAASWYLNGTQIGQMDSAVAINVPLCAIAWCVPRTTASAAITLDYFGVWGQ